MWRHVRAIGLLPGLGVVGIPALVLATTDFEIGWGTIALFAREGTLAPWDPTRKLVVRGPYRFVRNPMIVTYSRHVPRWLPRRTPWTHSS